MVADFSGVEVTGLDDKHLLVHGAIGRPSTSAYKASGTVQTGFRAAFTVSIVGPDATEKAIRTAEALLARGRMIFAAKDFGDFSDYRIEPIGAESAYDNALLS